MKNVLNRSAENQGRTELWPGTEPEFPSARYFQIHFEHLNAVVAELRREIVLLKKEMAQLRAASTGEVQHNKRLSS